MKYEIVSVTELPDGKVEVLAQVTRPNPDSLQMLWQTGEVFDAKLDAYLAAKARNPDIEDHQKIRDAKVVLRRFVERFERTREAVEAIDEFKTSEIHFVVKAATKDSRPKLLLAETWTPEGRAQQAESARVREHSLKVLQVLRSEFNAYDAKTFVQFKAYNPSNEKTGGVTAEVELLDEQGRMVLRDESWVPEIEPSQSDQVISMFDGAAPSRRWRVRFGADKQASPWYVFEGNAAVGSE